MPSLLIGLPLIKSHLRSPELNQPKHWHHHCLCFLSRSKVRTKPQVGHWCLHSYYLSSEYTAGKSLSKEVLLRILLSWCWHWEAVLLPGFVGLLISRKLWVEGRWDSYKLFAFTNTRVGCIREIKCSSDTSLCCQTGALGKQNFWWRTHYLGKKLQPKQLPSFDTTGAFSDDWTHRDSLIWVCR